MICCCILLIFGLSQTQFRVMNCIIVGNEWMGKMLGEFISKSSSVNLIGTFESPLSARRQLLENRDIDIAFLDVEITKKDNFNFIGKYGY